MKRNFSSSLLVWLPSLVALGFANAAVPALAWGPQGHQLVGGIADAQLKAHAKSQVAALIGMPLKNAANWADCVKDVTMTATGPEYHPYPAYHAYCAVFETPAGIAEMKDYVSRNSTNCVVAPGADPCHKQYHYADVASVHEDYERKFVGTSDHDIVAAIAAATAVLKGKPAPAPFKIKDKSEALLMLAHLVGDIHQPLHASAVYLTPTGQVIDPDKASPFDPHTETRGGNSIHDGARNLHAEWDQISGDASDERIQNMATRAKAIAPTSGPIAGWSAAWATDTVAQSHQAFGGLTFTAAPHPPGWTVQFADRKAYTTLKSKLQEQQLISAGARLAELLNAIWK